MDRTPIPETELLETGKLKEKLAAIKLPPDLLEKGNLMIHRAETAIKYGGYFAGIEQTENYINLVTTLPWFTRSEDIIDIQKAKTTLDKNHYGLPEIKDRILEYIAVLKLSKAFSADTPDVIDVNNRAPILLFVGLVGEVKTTIAASIA